MKRYYDLKRSKGPTFKVEEKVYLTRRNIKTRRPSEKLDFKKIGPYRIEKEVSQDVYRLKLPKGLRIHLTFYVSLLELALRNASLTTEEIKQEGKEEFEVEEVLNSRESQ